MEINEILERLPKHLLNLVIEQPYHNYTPQDHALWRYVMHQNVRYLSKVAHKSYLDGLKKTGISLEQIPNMYGMNRILKDIGWAAVAVDGFIPPSTFMEFQANNILVIAADIRSINQIGYTPAPDIIHEAAGHAPIIADQTYANYLREFGEVGAKAFSNAYDRKVYEAVRHLSILKADPYSDNSAISLAEKNLEELNAIVEKPSELAQIRNLHWWTVEYGLIGDLNNPKIYGAGLLSSITESFRCLQPIVKKIPYTLDAVNYSFDITVTQPQLFVTPDFETLSTILNEFADTMAYRKGGLEGIVKAINSEDLATIVYSSGLQVSGIVTDFIEKAGEPIYIKTSGPTNLNFEHKELPSHNKKYHSDGFGSPVGNINKLYKPLEDFSAEELNAIGFVIGEQIVLDFASGILVKGILKQKNIQNGKLILLSFSNCHVTYNETVLFQPEWGIYDMAVGQKITSAFTGVADPEGFGLDYKMPDEKTHKIIHSEKAKALFALYQSVRDIREKKCESANLSGIWDKLKTNHRDDWLCALEIWELLVNKNIDDCLYHDVYSFLMAKKTENIETAKLIDDAFEMLK